MEDAASNGTTIRDRILQHQTDDSGTPCYRNAGLLWLNEPFVLSIAVLCTRPKPAGRRADLAVVKWSAHKMRQTAERNGVPADLLLGA
jgi:hypothetical protein